MRGALVHLAVADFRAALDTVGGRCGRPAQREPFRVFVFEDYGLGEEAVTEGIQGGTLLAQLGLGSLREIAVGARCEDASERRHNGRE